MPRWGTRGLAALFAVPFFDELASGMPTAGAASFIAALHLSTTMYAVAVFAVPAAIAMLIEAPLFAFCDGRPHLRPRIIALSTLGMGAALLVEAAARGPLGLALGVTLYGPCAGLALGLAEGLLVDAAPDRVERTMARLTLLGAAGDIAAPLCLALGAVASSTSAALVGVAALHVVAALPLWRAARRARGAHAAEPGDAGDGAGAAAADAAGGGPAGLRGLVREALGNRAMLAWLVVTALCVLLDEPLTALAGLFSVERFGSATLVLAALSTGAAAGAVVVERLLGRFTAAAVIVAASALGAGGVLGLVACARVEAAAAWAFATGLGAAALYPLSKAQAYRCAPGRAALVNAAGQAFNVVDVAAPVLLALVADRFGVPAALACLLAQPVACTAMALVSRAGRSRPQGEVATAAATSSTEPSAADSTDGGGAPRR